MRRKDLVNLCIASVLTSASLFFSVSPIIAESSKVNHRTTLSILPFRHLFVKNSKIIGVAQLSDGTYNEVKVFENGIERPITSDIRNQYNLLLTPEIATQTGMDWANKHFWYQPVSQRLLEYYQKKNLDNSVVTITDNY